MAHYQHLPIYRTSYDLIYRIMHATKNFPREYKYTLGQEMKNEAMAIIQDIYRANSRREIERRDQIATILDRIQALEVNMRLAHDLRILPRKQYALLAEITERLGRQAQGWLKATDKKRPA